MDTHSHVHIDRHIPARFSLTQIIILTGGEDAGDGNSNDGSHDDCTIIVVVKLLMLKMVVMTVMMTIRLHLSTRPQFWYRK